MLPLTEGPAWHALVQHRQRIETVEQQRVHVSALGIELDYTHQHLNATTIDQLIALANERDLDKKIQDLVRGRTVNISENRPALHTALRRTQKTPLYVNDEDIMPAVLSVREQMGLIVNKIRSKQWLGMTNKPITNIVNIGMGGSDLGPRFCINALADYTSDAFGYHFISDVDPNSFEQTVAHLKPETTLFIVSSKSFTTIETLYNAKKAMQWIGDENAFDKHFIAVTAKPEKAHQFGIHTTLAIWDWVGGRYSFCSAINLIGAIAIGMDAFNAILAGAEAMDTHFEHTDFKNNLPVLLGLFGIWNNNFLDRHTLLLLTYARQLDCFVPYIQQVDMESNGKCIDMQGKPVHYATGPIVWGGLGNQAQHSYYQLLCQGTHQFAVDIITVKSFDNEIINRMAKNTIRILTNGIHNPRSPNGFIKGKTPLNHLTLPACSPFIIGALIALYEHKLFTQSVIWNINPFDQPGVESAKATFIL